MKKTLICILLLATFSTYSLQIVTTADSEAFMALIEQNNYKLAQDRIEQNPQLLFEHNLFRVIEYNCRGYAWQDAPASLVFLTFVLEKGKQYVGFEQRVRAIYSSLKSRESGYKNHDAVIQRFEYAYPQLKID